MTYVMLSAMVKQLLNDLIAAGYNQSRISSESGVDQSLISRLLSDQRGARPAYETVEAIKAVHARACRKRRRKKHVVPEVA